MTKNKNGQTKNGVVYRIDALHQCIQAAQHIAEEQDPRCFLGAAHCQRLLNDERCNPPLLLTTQHNNRLAFPSESSTLPCFLYFGHFFLTFPKPLLFPRVGRGRDALSHTNLLLIHPTLKHDSLYVQVCGQFISDDLHNIIKQSNNIFFSIIYNYLLRSS